MSKALLDTDIFSELLRAKNASVRTAADVYVKAHGRITLSVITVLEVVKGFQKAQREDAIKRFMGTLAAMEILDIGIQSS